MTFMIRPNQGVGDIVFGMTQLEVRSTMKEEPHPKRTDSVVPADFFSRYGMLVHYANDGIVEAVEMGSPATPTLLGKTLIGAPFEEVHRWLRSLDPGLQCDEAGLTSLRFGVGLYAPRAMKSPRDVIEGVIVFRPGYYD
jgi:hypothetical protein